VSASRLSPQQILERSPLALSLKRLHADRRITSRFFADNTVGLPTLYNQVLDSTEGPDIQVFVHDDVWIDDSFVADRLVEGLAAFDIIGVAGNRRRLPGQVNWGLDPATGLLDRPHVSGRLTHGRPLGRVDILGPAPAPCVVLDGVFIALRRSLMRREGLRFDPRFSFHFYDLDFCRTATNHGLRLSTWPIVITHASVGNYTSPAWHAAKDLYLAKWGD